MAAKLDALASPVSFSALFPGYSFDIANDQTLWRNYFTREFETKTASSLLSGKDSEYGVTVHMSFTGCLDILRDYGTDILILGASDTAQGLPPDELAKYFPGRRVLMCASPSLTAEAMTEFLRLAHQFPKIKDEGIRLTIFGLSTTLTYLPSLYYPALHQSKMELMNSYRQRDFLGRYSYWNSRFRIPWSWKDFIPVRKQVMHLPLPNQLERKSKDLGNAERWSILPFEVTRSQLASPMAIDQLRERYPPTPFFFSGNEDPECQRMNRLKDVLGKLRERAEAISQRSVYFLSPTMGDELHQAKPCYLPSVKSALAELRSDRTLPLNLDSAAYGLSVEDFAFVERAWRPDEIRLDMGHLNIKGARKFTAKLVELMKEKFDLYEL